MKTSLGVIILATILAPAAEARGGGGGGHGGGGHGGGGVHHGGGGHNRGVTAPFRNTVAIARQAAMISRLRAQQRTSDLITSSGGLLGLGGGYGGGFDGGYGGGFDGGFSGIGLGNSAALASLAPAPARAPVARMHIIEMTPSPVAPGQVQIIRGTSVETVTVK
jgi:hypothetical protein